ncbi:uncharacterized protein LOC111716383 [Eurytemora carolleeae]|uniref:uncharacterized protein LOC111716383 n=1 Tax=Eurytemora carolleeae TaxID=1294199 RepID=UPI000C75CAA7|nr:uncharacterized protein LOC111716383 [Eurytemora carolleeae]|eukprot:XP_023347597.1 uncharacterized protein LOC111716383 [Eurytemora affinis]
MEYFNNIEPSDEFQDHVILLAFNIGLTISVTSGFMMFKSEDTKLFCFCLIFFGIWIIVTQMVEYIENEDSTEEHADLQDDMARCMAVFIGALMIMISFFLLLVTSES